MYHVNARDVEERWCMYIIISIIIITIIIIMSIIIACWPTADLKVDLWQLWSILSREDLDMSRAVSHIQSATAFRTAVKTHLFKTYYC